MRGIIKKPMDTEKAANKYLRAFPEFPTEMNPDVNDLANYVNAIDRNLKRYQRAVSSDYTAPKKTLEALKRYASTPLATRVKSSFL